MDFTFAAGRKLLELQEQGWQNRFQQGEDYAPHIMTWGPRLLKGPQDLWSQLDPKVPWVPQGTEGPKSQ